MTGCVYDEQYPAEPTAHAVQYGSGRDRSGSAPYKLYPVRHGGRDFCEDLLSAEGFFHFDGFAPGASHDTDPDPLLRFLKNLGRNVRATGLYFLIGVLLSALFQRYVPAEAFASLFGEQNEGFGLLLAATVGVRHFLLYLAYVMVFSLLTGVIVNLAV